MLLAPFLWIFCEFDEKVLDNSFRVEQNKEFYTEAVAKYMDFEKILSNYT